MPLETYYKATTLIMQDARAALSNVTTSAQYAQVAREHLELLRKELNLVNESAPVMEDFPGVPQ